MSFRIKAEEFTVLLFTRTTTRVSSISSKLHDSQVVGELLRVLLSLRLAQLRYVGETRTSSSQEDEFHASEYSSE